MRRLRARVGAALVRAAAAVAPAVAAVAAVAVLAGAAAPAAAQDGVAVDLDYPWISSAESLTSAPIPAEVALSDSWSDNGFGAHPGMVRLLRDVRVPVGIDVDSVGILVGSLVHGWYDLYADGRLIGQHGSRSSPVPMPRERLFRLPAEMVADGVVELELWIHRDATAARAASPDRPLMEGMILGPYAVLAAERAARTAAWRLDTLAILLFAVVAVSFGLLYLLLYGTRRDQRAYLWFGLSSLLFALNAIALSPWTRDWFDRLGPAYRLTDAAGHAATITFALFAWAVLERPVGRWLRRYLVSHAVLAFFVLTAPLGWVMATSAARLAWLVPFMAVAVAVFVRAAWRGRVEAQILLVGGLALVVAQLLELGRHLAPAVPADLPYVGFVAVLLSMALTLAYRFASTHRRLTSLTERLELTIRERTASLEHAMREARAASEAKSRIMRMLTRELANPLTSIKGSAQLLLVEHHDELSDDARESLRQIASSSQHLAGLSAAISDLARIEEGRVQLTAVPVDLRPILDDIRNELRLNAQVRGVEIQVMAPAVVEPVETDPQRFRQLLLNLVSDAIRASGPGPVEVMVHAEAGRAVAIDIVGQGSGVVIDDDADRVRGHGLGLAIAHALARLLGYEVTADRDDDGGTTFTLQLA